jgi:Skp family chaperone for outer membrane proteins
MKKTLLLFAFVLSIQISFSQKGQTIAYFDMEYILENVPEYLSAQNNLDSKIEQWKSRLKKLERHIEVLKTDLTNEKAILTGDLIEEREEDITIKEEELARFESLYFGPNGDMFLLRKQLVKPVQDQIYNVIQSIAKRKRYDFVFDKSSELVMLYSNKKYDISELVLASISRTRLVGEKNDKNKEKNTPKELSAGQKQVLAKKETVAAKKLSDRETKKKAIADKRKELLKKRNEKRELLKAKRDALNKKKQEAREKQKTQDNNN